MKKVKGLRIDTVAVTEIIATPSNETEPIVVTAALYDMKSNEAIGITRQSSIWSDKTWKTYEKLQQCLEEDIVVHLGREGAVTEEAVDGTGTKGGLFPEK